MKILCPDHNGLIDVLIEDIAAASRSPSKALVLNCPICQEEVLINNIVLEQEITLSNVTQEQTNRKLHKERKILNIVS